MNKFIRLLVVALSVTGGVLLTSCSSTPSDEELRKLNDLQAQVRQLEDQVAAKTRENATLEKQNAEKNGKVQQCQADQDGVKQAMGGGK
ncbi:MAG: hypothetical protein HY033_04615 [Ignavibacteriae bacterium]|nr:hypothetical protein [Ignavibacteria bacterium]MBI3364172.1 hypothetical protein [Ignavibacteriota bacterium]